MAEGRTWRESPSIKKARKHRHDSHVFFVRCPGCKNEVLLDWDSRGARPCPECGGSLKRVASHYENVESVADAEAAEFLFK